MSRRRSSLQAEALPFDTLTLEGGLFVPELLEKAARGEASQQTEEDYDIPKGLKLQEEYGRSYRIASALWQGFAAQLVREDIQPLDATGTFVTSLLQDALGYADLQMLDDAIHATKDNERLFPVSAMALAGRIPVVIAPHDLDLDDPDSRFAIRGGGTRKKSAFQLAQEFLNAAPDALWAFCTNGRTIRLLRDADTLTRPAYLEFDLATILREGEDRYADFSALWRLLHVSRAGSAKALPSDCVWEEWKAEGHSLGLRVREGLRGGVTEALLILGTGFIAHRDNASLREHLDDGSLTKDEFFQQLLRLVYRFLFLFCAEERGLLHPPDSDSTTREYYAKGYSLRRFRSRSLRRAARDTHGDLWQSITLVFRSLATGESRLALPALGGLFVESQCPDLDRAALANRDLLAAMRQLRWSDQSGRLTVIDYRNMGPEELGSVYESLLELIPTVEITARRFGFAGITDEDSTSGNARKLTGSYYTPDSLVRELIKSALDPVIEQKLAHHPENPTRALLSLTIIDPACGSGHFLISAARRVAEKLAELRAPDGAVRPDDYRHALREVISHCIYGVDRNPMALELARTALWLEGFEAGQPLSFLDHHLQCGDALLGLTNFDQLRKGIAKDAYKPLSGDNKETCKNLAALNRDGLKALEKRLKNPSAELFDSADLEDVLQQLEDIEAMPDESTVEVEAKKEAYSRFLDEAQDSPLAHACDLFIAAYLTRKTPELEGRCPTTTTLVEVLFPQQGKDAPKVVVDRANKVCRDARVFHWPLRFAHIFGHGGFDCVLGNPPWERIKLQEQEYFATREPLIAAAKNKAERSKRIQWLSEGSLQYNLSQLEASTPPDRREVTLFQEFQKAKRLAEATSVFAHVKGNDGGRFPLTGVGDVNTYALFAETIEQIRADSGTAGFIVPTGIATDDSTKAYFSYLVENQFLVSLFDFVNTLGLFPNVESQLKFCLLTLGASPTAEFAAFLTGTELLADPNRRFVLSADDFRLINPNTRTCPIFRTEADAELTKKIYRRVPVLIEEYLSDEPENNPWGISIRQGLFHLTNDLAAGVLRDIAVDDDAFEHDPGMMRVWEGKLIHQFDHRWATYTRNTAGELVTAEVTVEQKQDFSINISPRYWVPEREVLAKIARAPKCVREAYRKQDATALRAAFGIWIEACHEPDLLASLSKSTSRQRVIDLGGQKFEELPTREESWLNNRALVEAQGWPTLTDDEIRIIREASELFSPTRQLLDQRSPRWFLGWRDITKTANERTFLAAPIPRAGIAYTIRVLQTLSSSPCEAAGLLANFNSIVCDFITRQALGGTHLSDYITKQLPIFPPAAYSKSDFVFIVPRVLELTYTANDLSGWAQDLGHDGPPFPYDPDRRALLRAELDAFFARLYGLSREELQYILDPTSTHGPDYPTVTFPGLKKNEIAKYGEYRTQRLVLDAWDRDVILRDLELPNHDRVPLLQPQAYWLEFLGAAAWLLGSEFRLETLWEAYLDVLRVEDLEPEANAVLGDHASVWIASIGTEPTEPGLFADMLETLNENGKLQRTESGGRSFLRLSADVPAEPDAWRLYDVAAILSIHQARPAEVPFEPVMSDSALRREAQHFEALERRFA